MKDDDPIRRPFFGSMPKEQNDSLNPSVQSKYLKNIQRIDIYCFGAIIRAMFTIKTTFPSSKVVVQTLDQARAELVTYANDEQLARGLIQLCKDCLNDDPNKMPKDGSELVQRLEMIKSAPNTAPK